MYSILIDTNITPTPEKLHEIGIQLSNGFSRGLSPYSWYIDEATVNPSDLEDRVNDLEDDISEKEYEISRLEDKVDHQEDTISDLRDKIAELNEIIASDPEE